MARSIQSFGNRAPFLDFFLTQKNMKIFLHLF
jgi:hypothetical protein